MVQRQRLWGRDKAALVRPSARGTTTCSPRCGGEATNARAEKSANGFFFFNVLNRCFHFVISHFFFSRLRATVGGWEAGCPKSEVGCAVCSNVVMDDSAETTATGFIRTVCPASERGNVFSLGRRAVQTGWIIESPAAGVIRKPRGGGLTSEGSAQGRFTKGEIVSFYTEILLTESYGKVELSGHQGKVI